MARLRQFVTPHYQSLMGASDDPLGRQVVAQPGEDIEHPALSWDPLDEKKYSPVPGLIHRYPHIALLLVTPKCFAYCRFCFRASYLNDIHGPTILERWAPVEHYLQTHAEIQEVLLSGGDPLMLSDAQFRDLGDRIRKISKDMTIRVGTRAPVFQPNRFSEGLLDHLEALRPVVLSIHVNHAREVTSEFKEVVLALMKRGISCYSQSVLLKGVNDDSATLRKLFRTLVASHVRPYYLHLCDRAQGTAHFMVHPNRAIELWRSLWGALPGMAIPHLVFDDASHLGKVPLQDRPTVHTDAEGRVLITSLHDSGDTRSYAYPSDV